MKKLILSLTVALVVFGSIFAASSALTASEIEILKYMIQEEKLARDVYLTLYEIYGSPIFKNIAESEQRHMDAVKTLLTRYNIPNPLQTDEIGEYADAQFEKLYNELVAEGKKSFADALNVGVKIEQLDIEDLKEAISKTNNADIKQVLTNLKKGSENHLEAFSKQHDTQPQAGSGPQSQAGNGQRIQNRRGPRS